MARIEHLNGPRWVICVGPRCRLQGSRRMAKQASRACSTSVIQAECLGLCGRAPVLVRYPDGAWYGGLNAEQLGDLLQSPGSLDDHQIPRRSLPASNSRELSSKPLPEVPSELN